MLGGNAGGQERKEPMTDRDTVVVTEGGSDSSMVAGILLVIVVLLAIWFFVLGSLRTPSKAWSNTRG